MYELVSFCGLVLGPLAGAFVAYRVILGWKPRSATAAVLRAVDDRTLWGGVVAGVVLAAVLGLAHRTASWATWNWPEAVLGPDGFGEPTSSLPLLLVSSVVWSLCFTTIVVAGLSYALLVLNTYGMWRREHGGATGGSGVVVAAAVFAFGAPAVVAVCYGVITLVIATVVRGWTVPRYVPAYHPENLGPQPGGVAVEWSVGRQVEPDRVYGRVWQQLSPDGQYRAASAAALHLVTVLTAYLVGVGYDKWPGL